MKCGQTEPLLTRYVLGDLDAAAGAAVKEHLAGCASCRSEVVALRATVELLKMTLGSRQVEGLRLDPARRERIRESCRPWRLTAVPWKQVIDAAAVVMILLVMAGMMLPALSLSREKARRAYLSRASLDASGKGVSPQLEVVNLERNAQDLVTVEEDLDRPDSAGKVFDGKVSNGDSGRVAWEGEAERPAQETLERSARRDARPVGRISGKDANGWRAQGETAGAFGLGGGARSGGRTEEESKWKEKASAAVPGPSQPGSRVTMDFSDGRDQKKDVSGLNAPVDALHKEVREERGEGGGGPGAPAPTGDRWGTYDRALRPQAEPSAEAAAHDGTYSRFSRETRSKGPLVEGTEASDRITPERGSHERAIEASGGGKLNDEVPPITVLNGSASTFEFPAGNERKAEAPFIPDHVAAPVPVTPPQPALVLRGLRGAADKQRPVVPPEEGDVDFRHRAGGPEVSMPPRPATALRADLPAAKSGALQADAADAERRTTTVSEAIPGAVQRDLTEGKGGELPFLGDIPVAGRIRRSGTVETPAVAATPAPVVGDDQLGVGSATVTESGYVAGVALRPAGGTDGAALALDGRAPQAAAGQTSAAKRLESLKAGAATVTDAQREKAARDADEFRPVSQEGLPARTPPVATVPPPAPAVVLTEPAKLDTSVTLNGGALTVTAGETVMPQGIQSGSGTIVSADEPAPVREIPPPVFNLVVETRANPFSTFSIDVDTASFTLARRALLNGQLPPPGTVRVEEFVNAFEYAYPSPDRRVFAVYADRARSPFRPNLELLRIGVRGKVLGRDRQRASILTFVVDTSGSMNTPDRLELVQQSLRLLVDHLNPQDSVAIVSFGSQARLVLDRTPVSSRQAILDSIESLQANGSTHLEAGLRLGYETASRHFRSSAINRVLLLSDGVANLGAGTAQEILAQVERYRKQGVFCSVFGFGQGTYDDAMLESLADRGDGVYGYVDSPAEAKRVFVDELSATLHVIARDVKIQVEFNPDRVVSYRQIGYENRHLEKEQFRDDAVDAGEVGSGQSVTALYELDVGGNPVDSLGTVRVRWKDPETGKVEELAQPLRAADTYSSFVDAPVRFRLAAAAAELADLLRGNPAAAGTDMNTLLSILRPIGLELHLDRQVQDLVRMATEAMRLRQ